MRRRTPWALVAACTLIGCAGFLKSQNDRLHSSVRSYHELLRWKKLDGAASFHVPENQGPFMARYAAAEDDLSIESIEIRAVTYPPVVDDEPEVAEVTVVAHAYLLPSTTLEKVVMVERWEYRKRKWLLAGTDKELVPPAPKEDEEEAAEPETTEEPADPNGLDPTRDGAQHEPQPADGADGG